MGNQKQVKALKQLDQADEARHQRAAVQHPARRRQLECERQEKQPCAPEHPQMPRPVLQLVEVDVAREEAVRLRRVAREQPLEVRGREAPSVGLEKATARRARQWWDVHGQNRILDGIPAQMIPSSVPTLVKASSAN